MLFRWLGDPNDFYRLFEDNKIIVVKTGKPYDMVGIFCDGFAKVKLNNKFSFINEDGDELCEFRYDFVDDFYEGLAQIEINGKQGYINKNGEEICPPIYDEAYFVEEFGLIYVVQDNKLGFLDCDGNEVCPLIYDDFDADACTEHFIAVSVEDKWGFIDKDGNEICEMKFDNILMGLEVEYEGKWLPLVEVELDEDEYVLAVEVDENELIMIDEI